MRNGANAHPLPWFRVFAANLISDHNFRVMRLSERGLLLTMLCECWVNEAVPADLEEMSRFLGLGNGEVLQAFTPQVGSFFEASEKGRLSPFLEAQRKEFFLRRLKQIEGGKKGAERKRQLKEERDLQGLP
jgi:hypothetical protein